jgi:DMSO reductase family type II enzyme heme b subunit
MGERGRSVNIWHWKADAQKRRLDPFREASVEEINAEGFGTLSVQSLEDQQLSGKGRWKNGAWEVIFVRALQTIGPWDARFESPGETYLSLALWDGAEKDRNANKLTSLWQVLIVE